MTWLSILPTRFNAVSKPMNVDNIQYILGGLIAAGLAAYLIYALIRPERF